MKNITVRLADISRTSIPIGYEGEQNHTRVTFYCAQIFDEYPDAVGTMVIKPTIGEVYPQSVDRDGSKLIWDVTASNCAYAGAGSYQFTFTQDEEIIKTVIGSYSVNSSIAGDGEPPEPVTDWVNQANEKLAEVEQFVQEIDGKLDAPEVEGRAGQVLTADGNGGQSWEGIDAGTVDYAELTNKPKINNVILSGNKSLSDLGIAAESDIPDVSGFYTKPSGGIPKTDLASAVQTSLGKADSAYQKSSSGIPATDLASAVQTSLGKADTAYQKPSNGIPGTDLASGVIPTVHNIPAGGTSGQVLKKSSGTDYAVEWGSVSAATDQQVQTAVDDWLDENITNPDSPPLDRSLTSSSAAAPADMVGDLKGEFDQVKDNQLAFITYINGNTNASGVVVTESDNKHMVSNLLKTYAGEKVFFKSSNTYNTAWAITKYDNNGSFIENGRTAHRVDKDADTVEVSLDDGFVRFSYMLYSQATMSDDIKEHIKGLLSFRTLPFTREYNGIEKIYDIDSEELNQGWVNRNTVAVTQTDRWRYIVHNCKQNDIYIYNGVAASTTCPVMYFDSTNAIIGLSHEPTEITVYRNEVIKIPNNCTRVCFTWFVADGSNPCDVYRFTGSESELFAYQKDIIDKVSKLKYDGLKICINGDSISTPSAGKWADNIPYHMNATFQKIAVGGTRMCGEINSETRVGSMASDTDIVLTDGGANDWAQNIPLGSIDTLEDPTTFAGAVQLYIERVMEQCPNARMICWGTNYVNFKNRFSVNPTIGEQNDLGLRITDYNETYKKVCEYNAIEFIDIYRLVGINRYNFTTYLEQDSHEYGYGYVHPNTLGGQKYLDAILNYLFYGIK